MFPSRRAEDLGVKASRCVPRRELSHIPTSSSKEWRHSIGSVSSNSQYAVKTRDAFRENQLGAERLRVAVPCVGDGVRSPCGDGARRGLGRYELSEALIGFRGLSAPSEWRKRRPFSFHMTANFFLGSGQVELLALLESFDGGV
jgi:hypothetical protein